MVVITALTVVEHRRHSSCGQNVKSLGFNSYFRFTRYPEVLKDALQLPLPKPEVWVNLPRNRGCKAPIKPRKGREFLSKFLAGLWFRQECQKSLLLVA